MNTFQEKTKQKFLDFNNSKYNAVCWTVFVSDLKQELFFHFF